MKDVTGTGTGGTSQLLGCSCWCAQCPWWDIFGWTKNKNGYNSIQNPR